MCCPPRVVYDGLHFLNTQGSLVRCCQEIGFFFFACFSVFCGGEVLPGNSFFFFLPVFLVFVGESWL